MLQAPVTRKAKTQFLLKLSPIESFCLKGLSLLETLIGRVSLLSDNIADVIVVVAVVQGCAIS